MAKQAEIRPSNMSVRSPTSRSRLLIRFSKSAELRTASERGSLIVLACRAAALLDTSRRRRKLSDHGSSLHVSTSRILADRAYSDYCI
jgi:hypothetical protein